MCMVTTTQFVAFWAPTLRPLLAKPEELLKFLWREGADAAFKEGPWNADLAFWEPVASQEEIRAVLRLLVSAKVQEFWKNACAADRYPKNAAYWTHEILAALRWIGLSAEEVLGVSEARVQEEVVAGRLRHARLCYAGVLEMSANMLLQLDSMDGELTLAGKTRADIGADDEKIAEAVSRYWLENAKWSWEQAKAASAEARKRKAIPYLGTLPYVWQALELAGKTLNDLGITQAEIDAL
jgi:hypothetical protein